ncbi:CENPT protein, partial [Polypterus senegalus]
MRVLLGEIINNEIPCSPVKTWSKAKFKSPNIENPGLNKFRKSDVSIKSPALALKNKMKEHVEKSAVKLPFTVAKRRSSRLKNEESSLSDATENLSSRYILKQIIRTEPVSEPLVINQPKMSKPPALADPPPYVEKSGLRESMSLDLLDLTSENIPVATRSNFRRKVKKHLPRIQLEENKSVLNAENPKSHDESSALTSHLSMSLKTPNVEEPIQKRGMRRKVGGRKTIDMKAFEEGVFINLHQRKTPDIDKHDINKIKPNDTSALEKFTLGISAVMPPDLTQDLLKTTQLFEVPSFISAVKPTPQKSPVSMSVQVASLQTLEMNNPVPEREEVIEMEIKRPEKLDSQEEKYIKYASENRLLSLGKGGNVLMEQIDGGVEEEDGEMNQEDEELIEKENKEVSSVSLEEHSEGLSDVLNSVKVFEEINPGDEVILKNKNKLNDQIVARDIRKVTGELEIRVQEDELVSAKEINEKILSLEREKDKLQEEVEPEMENIDEVEPQSREDNVHEIQENAECDHINNETTHLQPREVQQAIQYETEFKDSQQKGSESRTNRMSRSTSERFSAAVFQSSSVSSRLAEAMSPDIHNKSQRSTMHSNVSSPDLKDNSAASSMLNHPTLSSFQKRTRTSMRKSGALSEIMQDNAKSSSLLLESQLEPVQTRLSTPSVLYKHVSPSVLSNSTTSNRRSKGVSPSSHGHSRTSDILNTSIQLLSHNQKLNASEKAQCLKPNGTPGGSLGTTFATSYKENYEFVPEGSQTKNVPASYSEDEDEFSAQDSAMSLLDDGAKTKDLTVSLTQGSAQNGKSPEIPVAAAVATTSRTESEINDEDETESEAELCLKTPAFIRARKRPSSPSFRVPPLFLNKNIKSISKPLMTKSAQFNNKRKKTTNVEKQYEMPKNIVMSTFTHFARMKVSKDVYPTLQTCLGKYFDRLADDLDMYVHHAKRKTVEMADIELLMRRQGFVTEKTPLNVLIERHLTLEHRKLLIPCASSGNKVTPNI